MELIERISSPFSEVWVAWVLLLLLVLWIGHRCYLPELNVLFRGLFSRGDRSYMSSDPKGQYLTWLYELGIFGLGLQIMLCNTTFSFAAYAKIVGVLAAVGLVQTLLIRLVGWVFLPYREYDNAMLHRTLIINASYGLLPVVVLLELCHLTVLCKVLMFGLGGLYMVVLFFKALQLLYRDVLSVLYLLLYIISLELVPVACAVLWIKNIL